MRQVISKDTYTWAFNVKLILYVYSDILLQQDCLNDRS